MRARNSNKYIVLYLILGVVFSGLVYTALKDITPEKTEVKTDMELKLTK